MELHECYDYKAAARAGHLRCLQRFSKAGSFLHPGSDAWGTAGEARKAQVWEAAGLACGANHAHLLRWLFKGGWRSTEALATWQNLDIFGTWRRIYDWKNKSSTRVILELEYDLYFRAVTSQTPDCLKALLEAGCRSEIICAIAAAEGKAKRLTLAVQGKCPCGIWALVMAARSGRPEVLRAVYEAGASSFRILSKNAVPRSHPRSWTMDLLSERMEEGDVECLEALFGWFGGFLYQPFHERETFLNRVSAYGDQIFMRCLEAISRSGINCDWYWAAYRAASHGHLSSLQLALRHCPHWLASHALVMYARNLGTIKCLVNSDLSIAQVDIRAACEIAARKGHLETLQFWFHNLPHIGNYWNWDDLMYSAITSKCVESMQLLYNLGYERHRSQSARQHPAIIALLFGCLRGMQLALNFSGDPPVDPQDLETLGPTLLTWNAAIFGEDILQTVCGWGGTCDMQTPEEAARASQAGALRFALEKGAPLHMKTVLAAIQVNSLECLQCAYQHVSTVGLPEGYDITSIQSHGTGVRNRDPAYRSYWSGTLKSYCPVNGLNPDILKYIASDVAPNMSCPILTWLAQGFAGSPTWLHGPHGINCVVQVVDWWTVLFLARHLRQDAMPEPLRGMVASRSERAAALAGVCWRAGRLAESNQPSPFLPLWRAIGKLPGELRERIAFEAHLVVGGEHP